MQFSAISNHYLSWGTPNPDSKQSKITNVASRIFETAFISSATFSLVYSSLLALAYVTNVLNPLTPYLLAITTIAAAALYLYNLPPEHQALAIETAADVPNPKQAFKADLIVYNSGHQSWEMKKEMIRSAQQSIECSFNFAGGPFLHEFLDICSNRLMNSNVKIHLLLEDIISEKTDREKMEEIQRLYPDRFFYQIARKMHSSGSLVGTEENHSKLLVVDGKYFMMGSTGVHETFCGEPIEYNQENISKHRKTLPVARHEDSDIAGAAKDNLAFLMRDEFFRLYTVWSFRLKTPLKHNEGVYFSVDPTPTICASFDNHEKRAS
jgi:hypothetical protein